MLDTIKTEPAPKSYPLVSVVLLSYNHELFIKESIDSVLRQTYPNIELLVVDDHSTDGSAALIKKLQQGKDFVLIENAQNVGLQHNIIIGIQQAKGKYISILASDDIIVPEKTEKQMDLLLKQGYDGVYSTGFLINGNSQKFIKLNESFRKYSQPRALGYVYTHDFGAPLSQSALFNRKMLLENMDLRHKFKQDDWPLLIKSMERYKMGYIDEPLFGYRVHGSNMHKGYWATLPNRIDVISKLVPEKYRLQALANIFLSHSQYHLMDGKAGKAFRIFLASLSFRFSFYNIYSFSKTLLYKLLKS